jgi:hypothetical protein
MRALQQFIHSIPRTLAVLALLAIIAGALAPASSTAVTAASSYRLDPATYLGGGGGDYGRNVGLDAQGNIYLATDSYSSSILGHTIDQGSANIVVAKLSPDARKLLGFFTIGSAGGDHVGGMAVTPQGEVVLAVATDNPTFPTKNALQTALIEDNPGVLLKINATLDGLVFSTFTDFTVSSDLHTVALDGAGNISIAGYVYQPVGPRRDLVLKRFSPDGQQELYRKVWDGDDEFEEVQGLVVQPDGTTYIAGYVTGRWGGLAVTDNALQKICGARLARGEDWDCDEDAFVMRLTPNGTVDYASYLGGYGSDKAVGIAVDAQGAMYLIGSTGAQDFPTTPNALQPHCRVAKPEDGCYYDIFVAKLSPDGSHLVYSTYLASGDLGGLDYPVAIAVDGAGNATAVGWTASEQWPVKDAIQSALSAAPCPNAFQDRFCFDSVVTRFTPEGQLAFSSYLGGKGDEYSADVALGADGSIYLTGSSESLDFPVTAGTVQPTPRAGSEIFLAHIAAGTGQLPDSQRVYLPSVRR